MHTPALPYLVLMLALAGCNTSPAITPPMAPAKAVPAPATPSKPLSASPAWVRQDRYTLTTLFSRFLPAVQHQLGPMALLDALTILGGPAWRLVIDPVERSVCYALRAPVPAPPQPPLEIAP